MKFIYGEENYLIAKELKQIKDSFNGELIFCDDETDLQEIINQILTISMFGEKKLIIMKNIQGLYKDSEGEELATILNGFDDENTELVFISEIPINKKIVLVDFLLKNASTQEVKKLTERELINAIKDIVSSKGGIIKNSAVIKLSDKLPNNLMLITREIDKLLQETNNITDDVIKRSIGDYNREDFFALSNAISSSDVNGIIKSYNEKIRKGDDPLTVISQIASVYNLVYKVMTLKNIGYSNQDISDYLNVHIFRIKKSLDIFYSSSEEKINKIIADISELESAIKSGIIDPNIGLDNFMIQLIK